MRRSAASIAITLAAAATLAACDGGGGQDGGILIVTDALEDGRVRIPYLEILAAEGAVGEVEWELSGGELPPGIELTAGGRLEGAPLASGTYQFAVAASDDEGTDEVELELLVPRVVLMSGFEPFGGYETNPSWEAVHPLHMELVAGLDVRGIEIPVTWSGGWAALEEEIVRLRADVVIATGMAGTDAMRFETNAVNVASGADNDGETMSGDPIVDGGPDAYPDALPVAEMAAAMEAGGYATATSDDAGDFLCNHVFYNLMHWVQTTDEPAPVAAGFIHVPPSPYGASLTVEGITAAHRLGLEALAAWLESDGTRGAVLPSVRTAPEYFF